MGFKNVLKLHLKRKETGLDFIQNYISYSFKKIIDKKKSFLLNTAKK